MLLPVCGVTILSASATADVSASAASAGVAAIHGTLITVPHTFNFYAVSCPATGSCEVVGQQAGTRLGVVSAVGKNEASAPHTITGTFGLAGVACPKAGSCIAVGDQGIRQSALPNGVVVAIRNGEPGHPTKVSGVYLYAVGCGTASSCWATGETANFKEAVAVHLNGTHVTHIYRYPQLAADAFLFRTSCLPNECAASGPPPVCTSASSCTVVGTTAHWITNEGTELEIDHADGLFITLSNGRITHEKRVSGVSRLDGFSCTSANKCFATADPHVLNLSVANDDGEVVPITSGTPGGPAKLEYPQMIGPQMGTISCLRTGICAAASPAGGQSQVVTLSGTTLTGVAQVPRQMFVGTVACQTDRCVAAGGIYDTHVTGDEIGSVFLFSPPASS